MRHAVLAQESMGQRMDLRVDEVNESKQMEQAIFVRVRVRVRR